MCEARCSSSSYPGPVCCRGLALSGSPRQTPPAGSTTPRGRLHQSCAGTLGWDTRSEGRRPPGGEGSERIITKLVSLLKCSCWFFIYLVILQHIERKRGENKSFCMSCDVWTALYVHPRRGKTLKQHQNRKKKKKSHKRKCVFTSVFTFCSRGRLCLGAFWFSQVCFPVTVEVICWSESSLSALIKENRNETDDRMSVVMDAGSRLVGKT